MISEQIIQLALVLATGVTMCLMVLLTFTLMFYTCKLKLEYSLAKIFIRGVFLMDWWYFWFLYRWLKRNTLAIWSVPVMGMLIFFIASLGGLMFDMEIVRRTTEIIVATPFLWASLTGLIHYLLKKDGDLIK